MKKILLIASLCVLGLVGCTPTQKNQGPSKFDSYTPESVTLPEEGGEFIISYTLSNPIEGQQVEVIPSVEWISLTNNDMEGSRLVFNAEANPNTDPREASILVTYNNETSFTITVNQSQAITRVTAQALNGYYYGEEYSPGSGNYWIILSEKPSTEGNNTFYRVDCYGALSSLEWGEADMIPIAEGVYNFDANNSYAQGTFSAEYSAYWQTGADGNVTTNDGNGFFFEGGKLTVTSTGMVLEARINGVDHIVTYEGVNELLDKRTPPYFSTLTEDLVVNLGDAAMVAVPYGDYYECGAFNWMFNIIPNNESGIGEYMMFDVNSNFTTEEEGFAGTYSIIFSGEELGPNTCIYGSLYAGAYLQGSWWYNSADGAEIGEMAPLGGGTFTVVDNGDSTVTFTFDLTDDNGHAITGTWTGPYQIQQPQATRNFVELPAYQPKSARLF